MAPLLGLLSLACGLWFLLGMPALTAVLAWKFRRGRSAGTGLIAAVVTLAAFYLTAGLLWRFGASDWNLSFLTTLEASVDSEKYGHPVEHRAEVMVVWLLLYSAMASAVAGSVAAGIGRYWVRCRG